MKKKINLSVLIFVVISLVAVSIIAYRTLDANKLEIEEMLSSSKREIEDLNKIISANDIVFVASQETLNGQIDSYETIIGRWIDYDYFTVTDISFLKKSYDLSVMIHVDDNSFPLPSNGIINVDSGSVELEIKYKIPPTLIDKELNNRVHYYDTSFEDIRFDDPDEYFKDENTIRIKYVDLELGDKRNAFLGNDLKYLLNLTDSRVQIIVTDTFPDSKAYRPVNVKEKKFIGGLFKTAFTHHFTYLNDDSWILKIDDELKDFILMAEYDESIKYMFEYDEELKISGISKDDLEFNAYDSIILPSKLRLGTTWEYQNYIAMITAVDFSLDTGLGILNTVEVTYRDQEGYIGYISYFAENLGLVHRKYGYYGDNLYDVTYYK